MQRGLACLVPQAVIGLDDSRLLGMLLVVSAWPTRAPRLEGIEPPSSEVPGCKTSLFIPLVLWAQLAKSQERPEKDRALSWREGKDLPPHLPLSPQATQLIRWPSRSADRSQACTAPRCWVCVNRTKRVLPFGLPFRQT